MRDWRWALQSPRRLAGTVAAVLVLVAVLTRLLPGGAATTPRLAVAAPTSAVPAVSPSPPRGASSPASSTAQSPAPTAATTTPTPTPTPTPETSGGLVLQPVGPAVVAVATAYVAAREGAVDARHATARDWLEEVRPVMTPTGWAQLAVTVGDSGGYPAATAHEHQWSVRATVACERNDEAGGSAAALTLTCSVTDQTVTATGVPVAASELPVAWPLTGPQPPAVLALVAVDGRWLVDADHSGQAG